MSTSTVSSMPPGDDASRRVVMMYLNGMVRHKRIDYRLSVEEGRRIFKMAMDDVQAWGWEIPRLAAAIMGRDRSLETLQMFQTFKQDVNSIAQVVANDRPGNIGSAPLEGIKAPGVDPPEALSEIEIRERLDAEIDRLPQKQREVIRLIYWGGLTVREIAVRLNCSPNTVNNLRKKAVDKLGRALRPR